MSDALDVLFSPASVAVVGASADPAKWGHWIARGAVRGSDRREVWLVNRRGVPVLGRETFVSLEALPDSPELAVLVVPPAGLGDAVDDALACGARALVAITAGVTPDEEVAIAAQVRAAGARLLGPNCLGVSDAGTGLHLLSNDLPPGPIGLISQSGNLMLEVGELAARHGLGFSRAVSLGNQADLIAADLVRACAGHAGTRVIALYVEDFRDARDFAAACSDAVAGGTPVVLLTVGRSAAGARAAFEHTGARVSDDRTVRAACDAAGIHLVRSPVELADTVAALLCSGRAHGRRVAIVADGGGHGALAADAVVDAGLDVPPLGPALCETIAHDLPTTASVANPIDFAGGGEQDLGVFARIPAALLADPSIDAVLLTGYFGGYAAYSDAQAADERAAAVALAGAAIGSGRALVVHSMFPASPAAETLRAAGIPVYADIVAAARGLAAIVRRDGAGGSQHLDC